MKRLALAAAIAAAPFAAQAEPEQLYFDPNHTQIGVDWTHYAGATLSFYFTEWDAELIYDEEDIANSSVDVTVPLSGLWTGVDNFTSHLQSGDFFEAETWPSARFVSTSIERTGETTATMTGDLTIRDVTAPVTFDVEMVGEGGEGDRYKQGFKAWTTLDRTEWDLGLYAPFVPAEVKLVINAELQSSDPDAE